jgi:plastocyanin
LRSFLAIFLIAAAFGVLGAADSSATSAPTAAPVVVHIASFAFKPADVTVQVGDSVTFVNDDSVAHTVTASDKSFDSGNLDANAKWTHTFNTAGSFSYGCAYHPTMQGTITVKQ